MMVWLNYCEAIQFWLRLAAKKNELKETNISQRYIILFQAEIIIQPFVFVSVVI